MEMLTKTGRYGFLIEPFHCDISKNVFIGHLGNHMLNAADFHSNERGYGMNYLNSIHRTWVLSRLVVEMNDLPKAYDHIQVETWVESVMRYFTSRNFAVTDDDGKIFGYGRSIWAMIDTDTRQPVDIMAVRDGLIMKYVEKEKECPIDKPSRVKVGGEAELVGTIGTRYSDVDVNGHINSVKYIEHILDLWDVEWHRRHDVKRFDIAYVAESYYGDELGFQVERQGDCDFCVRVTKCSHNGAEAVEVCRCKIKFAEK